MNEDMCDTEYMSGVVELPPYSNDNIIDISILMLNVQIQNSKALRKMIVASLPPKLRNIGFMDLGSCEVTEIYPRSYLPLPSPPQESSKLGYPKVLTSRPPFVCYDVFPHGLRRYYHNADDREIMFTQFGVLRFHSFTVGSGPPEGRAPQQEFADSPPIVGPEDDQIPVLHRIERVFRVRQDILHFSDTYLIRYFRFPRQEIIYLCDLLDPIIGANTNRSHSIPTVTKVLASLAFFASGSFQNVVGRIVGVCQPSCSRILATVLEGLKRLAPTHIVYPLGEPQKIAHLKTDFGGLDRFPNVIGAIDCCHVAIKAPTEEENPNERCSGVLKSRFRCIHKSMGVLEYTPSKCKDIIVAVCVIHNLCVNRNIPLLDPSPPNVNLDAEFLPWPARSFDYNPIENPWSTMAFRLAKIKPKNGAELRLVVTTLWQHVTVEEYRRFVDCMPEHIKMGIKTKGGAIDY
uniref:Nuclease HARBI1 n=1 Tax=Timema douglasi TaxID=61478 RepID=A0A7R8VKK6_TIMDO|nr:unnamed protein product [Timema douglasi]